ncbi:MAG: 50S ribosomal protein L1 [Candidatus Micrarchaeota archaeon]|nr:MAG: 50S ribosomal protein L1 [Candidatus Micrarchaeota archaeon]
MDLNNIVSTYLDQNKKKRRFLQTVDLIVNIKGYDFSKQENRANFDIRLPNGRGSKKFNIVIFADDTNIVQAANKLNATVIDGKSISQMQNDKQKLKLLLNRYTISLAQPNLLPVIARALGPVLGPKGKLPKPIAGNLEAAVTNAINTVSIKSKGKYIPTLQCAVGTEDMESNKIVENIDAVLDAIIKKYGRNNIKSVYIKLTMAEPLRIM